MKKADYGLDKSFCKKKKKGSLEQTSSSMYLCKTIVIKLFLEYCQYCRVCKMIRELRSNSYGMFKCNIRIFST